MQTLHHLQQLNMYQIAIKRKLMQWSWHQLICLHVPHSHSVSCMCAATKPEDIALPRNRAIWNCASPAHGSASVYIRLRLRAKSEATRTMTMATAIIIRSTNVVGLCSIAIAIYMPFGYEIGAVKILCTFHVLHRNSKCIFHIEKDEKWEWFQCCVPFVMRQFSGR